MPKYIVQKNPVIFHVQGNRNGQNTPDPIPGFEWRIVNAVTGDRFGDPFSDEERANAKCMKLNGQSE